MQLLMKASKISSEKIFRDLFITSLKTILIKDFTTFAWILSLIIIFYHSSYVNKKNNNAENLKSIIDIYTIVNYILYINNNKL